MKNQRYTSALLFVLTLFVAMPVLPNNPVVQSAVPGEGVQSAKNVERYWYLFNLGIDAGNVGFNKGPEHVIPDLGQQAAQELAQASLMRSCTFRSPYQKELASSAISSTFAGVRAWTLLQKYKELSLKQMLALSFRHGIGQFIKKMTVNLAYRGIINAANHGLSSCGSSHRLGRYPRWVTNNLLLLMFAMEVPRMCKGVLGSVYDYVVFGIQGNKKQVKKRGEFVVTN